MENENKLLIELLKKQKEINENFDTRLKNMENTILPAIPEKSKKLNECKKIINKTYKDFKIHSKQFNYYFKKLNFKNKKENNGEKN